MIISMRCKSFNDDKGQVSIDYIIGISIFIMTFFFLYNILTSLFLPFQSNSDEIKAIADRVGTVLVESSGSNGLAIGASSPNILDKTKVTQLNNNLNNSYDDRQDKLGLTTSVMKYNLNVSLRYLNNSLYPNSTNPLLLGGPARGDYTNVAQTIRLIYLEQDSKRLQLVVEVW